MKCCDEKRGPARSFANIAEGSRIVCTLTGHGLKDPEIVAPNAAELKTIAASTEAVLREIGP